MIKVDAITMRYLELLHFEVTGLQNILQKIAVKSKDLETYVVDEETKKYYLNEYLEKNKEYEVIKKEIINQYVPEDKKNMMVTFDFDNLSLELNEKGKCSC